MFCRWCGLPPLLFHLSYIGWKDNSKLMIGPIEAGSGDLVCCLASFFFFLAFFFTYSCVKN